MSVNDFLLFTLTFLIGVLIVNTDLVCIRTVDIAMSLTEIGKKILSKLSVNAEPQLSATDKLVANIETNLLNDPHYYDEKTAEERSAELEELNRKMQQLQRRSVLDYIPGYRTSKIIDAAGIAFTMAIKAATLKPIKPEDDPKIKGH